MIKKRTMVVLLIITMVLTSVATFTISNVMQLSTGSKILMSEDDFAYYKGLNERFGKVIELQKQIDNKFYLETEEVDYETGVIQGLFSSLEDPYSVYFTKAEFDSFMEQSTGTYGGIGVYVSPGDDGLITVVSPIEDTPGERAGLVSGDKIVKVNDEDVYGDKIDEAVSIMKGEPGTDVVLTIMRDQRDFFDVTITREQIVIKSVKSRVINDDIGYLRITAFDEKSAQEFSDHLNTLKNQNVQGLIIDLRNNPGGSLDQVVKIADEILGKQVIVYTKDRQGRERYERSDAAKVELPITVLVNGGSASASEILTGAIKDSDSGTIIGTTTFGKGLVQEVIQLMDGSAFKITISQYFTPNGSYINDIGIEPDITIELPEELQYEADIQDEQDVQLQKAIEVLEESIN